MVTAILPLVPSIVLLVILPSDTRVIIPVVVISANDCRSLSYVCADSTSTVPISPYSSRVVGLLALVILPLESTVTLV